MQYFDFKWFNDVTRTFPYKFSDKSAASDIVGGNAIEIWTIVHLLPVMIDSKVPCDDTI